MCIADINISASYLRNATHTRAEVIFPVIHSGHCTSKYLAMRHFLALHKFFYFDIPKDNENPKVPQGLTSISLRNNMKDLRKSLWKLFISDKQNFLPGRSENNTCTATNRMQKKTHQPTTVKTTLAQNAKKKNTLTYYCENR